MRQFVIAATCTAFLAGIGITAAGCPPVEEEEDPCKDCTVTEQRNECVAVLRDECEQFADGTQEHEDCHDRAAAKCTGAGEGEGEGQ